jgi:hypothetical protein
MAITFLGIVIRSQRRLRVLFTNTLGGGAFVTTWYTITNLDGAGPDVPVRAALVVPDVSNGVELALGQDLVGGSLYELDLAAGIPAGDLSTLPHTTSQFRPGEKQRAPSPDVSVPDIVAELYNIDLRFESGDFRETPAGDLATRTGPENVMAAAQRRAISNGLRWDQNYGGKPRRRVDAPSVTLPGLRGQLVRQLLLDDRIKKADATASQDNDGDAFIDMDVTMLGDVQLSEGFKA